MSDDAPVAVTLRLPTPETPGYLRRQIKFSRLQIDLSEIQAQAKDKPGDFDIARKALALMERMAEAAAEFVEPPPGVAAVDAIMELSERDFNALFGALGGAPANAPLAAPSEPPSAAG